MSNALGVNNCLTTSTCVGNYESSNMASANIEMQQNSHRMDSENPQGEKVVKRKLRRSKSFGGIDLIEASTSGFDRENIPRENQGIVKQAMHDPDSFSFCDRDIIIKILCRKAVQNLQNAESAAYMCCTIIENEKGHTFVEILLSSCWELYKERDKVLRSYISMSGRWTAYLCFLTYLRLHFQNLYSRQCLSIAGRNSSTSIISVDHCLLLSALIYECCETILTPPSVYDVAEIESLQAMLTIIGRQLEIDFYQKMQEIIALIWNAFSFPFTSELVRSMLFRLMELQANEWRLALPRNLFTKRLPKLNEEDIYLVYFLESVIHLV